MTDVPGYRLEEFVGDTERFFSEDFNKAPLVRKGALTHRLADLPSVAELDELLALESVPPSYLRISKHGKGVPAIAYTRTVGRGAALSDAINPEKVYDLFRSGGTVTWNSLNHLLTSTRPLVSAFAEAFACTTEVVLFATPAGHDGFAPHHDSIDVFVVQLEGTKDWRVWDVPAQRAGDEASYTADELGEPALAVTLEPGDVLYVPHGTPHAAAAKRELAVHISMGVEPRRWRDLLLEAVQAIVEDEDFHAFPQLDAGQSCVAEFSSKLGLLQDKLAKVDPAAEAERLIATGRAKAGANRPRVFERLSAVDSLQPDARIRRTSVAVEIDEPVDGKTGIQVEGHRLAVPDAIAAALLALKTGDELVVADFFPGASQARSLRATQALARLGLFELLHNDIREPTMVEPTS